MSKILFRLRGVPEDEAEEVRALLVQEEIDFFETSAGNWGISLPALWVKDESDFERARALLDGYQRERALRVREAYRQSCERGEQRRLGHSFREAPIRFVLYMALIAAVLFLSLYYFLSF